MATQIHGAEYSVGKIFSNDFVFKIPAYQRPYAWTTEHAGELLSDFLNHIGDSDKPIYEINPYFLGSIVLIKGDAPDAQIVDGQQRLTTLSILLSAIRHICRDVAPDFADALTPFLYERGNAVLGTVDRPRLSLRDRDTGFFYTYIQAEGGMNKLVDIAADDLQDVRRNIRDNGLYYLEQLRQLPTEKLKRLSQFIVNRCFLIIISTPDLEYAYRIFSVLNNRGMDLSETDILKAEILGAISEETDRSEYNEAWEDVEETLGRRGFRDLFSHIRMIDHPARPSENLLAEIRKVLDPTRNPQAFIEKKLLFFGDAYSKILNAQPVDGESDALTAVLFWLNKFDNTDWLPPAILFHAEYAESNEQLARFFNDLERLAVALSLERANKDKRIQRYSRIVKAIVKGDDLYADGSPLQLTAREKESTRKRLDGAIYPIHPILRRYILLRLEETISANDALYQYPAVSVDQVLPYNPSPQSTWREQFPDPPQYASSLANITLLSRKITKAAQQQPFKEKQAAYQKVQDEGYPFMLTTQVLREKKWTEAIVQRRQRYLLRKLVRLWRLE